MGRPTKETAEKSIGKSVSFEKNEAVLKQFQKLVKIPDRSDAVNAALRTCVQAIQQKKLMREDFHLSQMHD